MLMFWDDEKKTVIHKEIDDANVLISEAGEPFFSWYGCDCCNPGLGATVTMCKIYPSLEYAQKDKGKDYWEKTLCDKCIYEHHYGIGSYES